LLKQGFQATPLPSGEAGQANGNFTPPTPEQLAAQFPDLEVLEFVGQGGMGMVYKARQKRLDRLVALKILSPAIARDPAFAERFTREARTMAMLSHPHIVAVHDFGQKDNLYYFLMEFVDGLTLRQLLDAGKLAPQEALAIVPQICEALQFAHDKDVVHRDIKPENILMDRSGQVKIADFGLAKLVGQEAKDFTITDAGQVIGTPHYMAPEQIEHPLQVDHRADIYSLGVVFYQILTGELPIGRFAPPSKKVMIDVRLDEVVLRALEKEPELRYQQASEIKSQVETIVTTAPQLGAMGAEFGQGRKAKQAARNLPLFVEREGRRHVYWPGVLLFCGTLGLVVLGVNLAIALALWLLTAEAWPMFQPRELPWVIMLMAACAVMRQAALKLGSREAIHAGSPPSAKVSRPRRIMAAILVMTGGAVIAAALAAGTVFFTNWMRTLPTTALADGNNIARFAVWIALSFAVGLFVIHCIWRSGSKRPMVTRGRMLPLVIADTLFVLAGTLFLAFYPADLEIQCKGTLEPVDCNAEGPWEVELHMPEDRMGDIARAAKLAEERHEPLSVANILATDPGTTLKGTVKEIARSADIIEKDVGNVAVIKVAINKQEIDPRNLRAGATVIAKVYCGRRSLGYVWYHDLMGFLSVRSNSGTERSPSNRAATTAVNPQEIKSSETAGKPSFSNGLIEPTSPKRVMATVVQADPLKSARAAEMRTIILAALKYATEHPEWPRQLEELVPECLDAGKIDLGRFVYHPLGPESLKENPQDVAVLAEKAPTFAGGQLVGFADGYVEFIKDAERLKRLFPTETESPPAGQEKKREVK